MLQKKYVDEIKRCFDGYNLLMMPLYEEEIHGRDFLLNFAKMMTETTLHQCHSTEAHPLCLCDARRQANIFHINKILHSVIPISPPFIIPANPPLEKEDSGSFSQDRNRLPIPKATIEFLMFGGKGGVGKTTIASASALSLSDIYPEKRILLFSTDPAHSLSDCLGVVVGGTFYPLKIIFMYRKWMLKKSMRN